MERKFLVLLGQALKLGDSLYDHWHCSNFYVENNTCFGLYSLKKEEVKL